MTTMLQIFKPSGTLGHFPNQQPNKVPILDLLEFQARNLLTFLVVAQVITLVAVHHLLRVCIPFLCQVLHQPHCLQIFQVITNDVSPVTDGFMDGYLRSYFTKQYPFLHTNILAEEIRKRHLHVISSPVKRAKKRPTTFLSPKQILL